MRDRFIFVKSDYKLVRIDLDKNEKEHFEALKNHDHLQPNPSVKEKIFRAFRNYFNR